MDTSRITNRIREPILFDPESIDVYYTTDNTGSHIQDIIYNSLAIHIIKFLNKLETENIIEKEKTNPSTN